MYDVYVKINTTRHVTDVASSEFLHDASGWIKIDSGRGYRYMHAQGNYFDHPLMDERGVYLYALNAHDKPYKRTQEEMDAEYAAMDTQPTQEERIATLEAQLAAYEAAYAEGVNEA